jgi:hypothetical protein
LSGIAEPDWGVNDDDNLYFEEFLVRLGVFALSIQQVTVTVGLASVANGDSALTWALNQAWASLDSSTGELLLNVKAAALGEHTALSRFGYQIVAIVQPITVKITVEVGWPESLWNPPAADLSAITAQIKVVANEQVPGSGQMFGSQQTVAVGSATSMRVYGKVVFADFEIDGAPLYKPLVVSVTPGSAFSAPPGQQLAVVQTSGPGQFTLTQTAPQEQLVFAIQAISAGLQ